MKKILFINLFLILFVSQVFAEITIDKFIKIKADRTRINKLDAIFTLNNGSEKRICKLCNLSNNDTEARAEILARGEELFADGRLYKDISLNIVSPAKDFIDNLPSLSTAETAVNNISNLNDAKALLLKVVRAIYAIKNMLDD